MWTLSTTNTDYVVADVRTLSTPETCRLSTTESILYISCRTRVDVVHVIYCIHFVQVLCRRRVDVVYNRYCIRCRRHIDFVHTRYCIRCRRGLMLYTPDNVYFVRRRVDAIHTRYCIRCRRHIDVVRYRIYLIYLFIAIINTKLFSVCLYFERMVQIATSRNAITRVACISRRRA